MGLSSQKSFVFLVFLTFPMTSFAVDRTVLEGRDHLANANFEQALKAFDRAEQGATLSLEDLVAIYEGRVMAHLALGEQPALQQDLKVLASLDPQHRFGPEFPPDVHEAFERAKTQNAGALAVDVQWETLPGGVAVTARAKSDVASLVREIRLSTRVSHGKWRRAPNTRVVLPTAPGEPVDAFAEAIGPGGAIVAKAGTREEPVRYNAATREAMLADPSQNASLAYVDPQDEARRRHDKKKISPWVWVGVGTAAAAGIVVAVILLTTGGGNSNGPTTVHNPKVEF